MGKPLDFEAKVQGLLDCHEAIGQLTTDNAQFGDIANEDIFYWSGGASRIASALAEARWKVRKDIEYDIACHARREYGDQGLGTTDLRQDSQEMMAGRADVLAMMTVPLTPELRQERATRIAAVLSAIATGQTIRATQHDRFGYPQGEPVNVTADTGRGLFGQFRNGHISSRVLTIHYDSPHSLVYPYDMQVGTPLVNLDLPALVEGDQGIRLPARWI